MSEYETMKPKKRVQTRPSHGHILLTILLILTICLIWGQSFLSQSASSAESAGFTERVIKPLARILFGRDDFVREAVVRKLAHATEHAVLGFELLLYLRQWRWMKTYLRAFSAGVLVAFLDESLQMLTGRGPAVLDVWIDAAGVAAGILFAALVLAVADKIKRRKNKRCNSV